MTNLDCKKSCKQCLATALAAIILITSAPAQTLLNPPQRWLLVFDTSIAMKNRLAQTTTEVENIFISDMTGQLHEGDSVGIWTFAKKLRAADHPLVIWVPGQAASEASELIGFLNHRDYLGRTYFSAIEEPLKKVIAHSQRLTIVIFCDGSDDLKLTPYDEGINQAFNQLRADRDALKQPFVVVVRTQGGGFVGATVNLPPGNLDFPPFPPLPQDSPVVPVSSPPAAAAAPAAPAVVPPPLVIVGTNVITNTNDLQRVSQH
jgi:hypothetical protein